MFQICILLQEYCKDASKSQTGEADKICVILEDDLGQCTDDITELDNGYLTYFQE